jgi:hypothetical protein
LPSAIVDCEVDGGADPKLMRHGSATALQKSLLPVTQLRGNHRDLRSKRGMERKSESRTKENTMLTAQLVTMIEKHADQLTRRVVQELETNPRTPTYHTLDPQDNYTRVYDVVSHLGDWLDFKSEAATERAYRKLGQKRFREGIPISEVVSALTLTKQTLRRYIKTEGWVDSAMHLYQQIELYDMISHFFDRAIYFTVSGYEAEAQSAKERPAQPDQNKHRFGGGVHLRRSANAG